MTFTLDGPQRTSRLHRPTLGALLITLALLGAACGGTSTSGAAEGSATTQPSGTASTPTTEGTEPGTGAVAPTASSTAIPEAMLADAVAQLGDSYLFSSEVMLDGSSVSTATGRNIGDATEVVLEQQGITLAYRSIDVRRWVQTPNGTWEQLADSADAASPLVGLDQPTTVQILSSSPSVTLLIATYNAAVLSLDTPDDLTVTLTITDGTLTNLDYNGDLNGQPVELHTTFTPATGLVPISAP